MSRNAEGLRARAGQGTLSEPGKIVSQSRRLAQAGRRTLGRMMILPLPLRQLDPETGGMPMHSETGVDGLSASNATDLPSPMGRGRREAPGEGVRRIPVATPRVLHTHNPLTLSLSPWEREP